MKKILLLANDAGGAEFFSSLVKAESDFSWSLFAPEGSPALANFKNNHLTGKQASLVELHDINQFDLVLFNPGWNAFPLQFVQNTNFSIPVIAVLEHWSDYTRRFKISQSSPEFKPDGYIVTDNFALAIARSLQWKNVYCLKSYSLLEKTALLQKHQEQGKDLLFISQYVETANSSEGFNCNGVYELNILQELLQHFEDFKSRYAVERVVIRLHPAQQSNPYKKKLYTDEYSIQSSYDVNLTDAIKTASMVVGLSSIALLPGLLSGKKVIAILPEEAREKTSPFYEISYSTINEFLRYKGTPKNCSLNLFTDCTFNKLIEKIS